MQCTCTCTIPEKLSVLICFLPDLLPTATAAPPLLGPPATDGTSNIARRALTKPFCS